jgi:hypothetical protein
MTPSRSSAAFPPVQGKTSDVCGSADFQRVLEVPVIVGGPSRTRTLDPLIKSQLLYQLS